MNKSSDLVLESGVEEVVMRNFLLLLGIMVMVGAAHAATYEWVDSQGVMHFTDDSDKIPVKYRSKARQLDLTPVPGEKELPPAPPQNPPAVETIPPVDKATSLYGGHNETWWLASFKARRDEIKTIQEALPDKKEKLNELRRKRMLYQKPGDRTAYYDLMAEIEKDEARINELQGQLTNLEAEAAKSGVPREWRH
jgi:hypothetical protein